MRNILNKVIKYRINNLEFINFYTKHKRIIIPFIFILIYVLLYFLLDFSSQSLVAHDEGLYARRSRLIEESSNWFSSPFPEPHHKTLGSYWFIALSIRIFGNSELALRLPSILFSFLSSLVSYLIAIKISNKKSALISLFSLSVMPLWIQYSRYASPDILFVSCILLTIFFFLKFLESTKYKDKNIYIFISGLFIPISFFLRSYMAFVPLIGLLPFLFYNLFKVKNIFRTFFFGGIFLGSVPTIINLYFSYQAFGIEGITVLFDFAKKQAVGSFDISNLLLLFLKYLYLTFPIGVLFIILLIFTKSNKKINYPLLVYCYPLLSLSILLSMSTSYPHYYLFLLPSLSNLFGVRLDSYSIRYSFSNKTIKYILLFFIVSICSILLSVIIYFNSSLIEYSYKNSFWIYIISAFLILSLIFSLRFLFVSENYMFSLKKFFYSVIIPQYISISLLYNLGVVGSPNYKIKSFLTDKTVLSIININTIYLYNVDSKIQTLLSYYLPSSKLVTSSYDINQSSYLITSDNDILYDSEGNSVFRPIKRFDNHYLLIKINK